MRSHPLPTPVPRRPEHRGSCGAPPSRRVRAASPAHRDDSIRTRKVRTCRYGSGTQVGPLPRRMFRPDLAASRVRTRPYASPNDAAATRRRVRMRQIAICKRPPPQPSSGSTNGGVERGRIGPRPMMYHLIIPDGPRASRPGLVRLWTRKATGVVVPSSLKSVSLACSGRRGPRTDAAV